jgi:transposase InsO family protein
LAAKGIPARSPKHNAVVERFHGTIPATCLPPRHFTLIRQLQRDVDAWLITYHHRRRNHSDYMRGRTPHQVLDKLRRRTAA